MDAEVKKALDDLSGRIDYQEHIHRNLDATPAGFMHGVVSNLPAIIVAVLLSGMIAVIIVNSKTKA